MSVTAPRRFTLTGTQVAQIEKLRGDVRLEEGGSRSFRKAGGQCGIVSDDVAGLLQERGVDASEYWGGAYVMANDEICFDHCWVELADGTIVDATADQFQEGDSVRVVSPTSPLQRRYLKWQEITNVVADLRARAERVGAQKVLRELESFDVQVGVFGDTCAAEYAALVAELS
jgi:hypothetical protein